MNKDEIIGAIESDERWDTGELGRDEASVKVVELTSAQQQAMDDAVGLQLISIRLPKALIEDFKFLGDYHGIKYQTLMRQILARFAESEKKNMARKAASAQIRAARKEADDSAKTGEPGNKRKAA